MKTANKIVSLMLVGILVSSIIGVSINEHYCHHNEVITSIGIHQNTPCSCEIPMQDDCCNNISTFYALTGLFNFTPSTISSQPNYMVLEPIRFKLLALANQPLTINVSKDISYPLTEPKVYLKVQSLLL